MRNLSRKLKRDGYDVSHRTVRIMLHDKGYSLKNNKKSNEGKSDPDRDERFRHIYHTAMDFMKENQPVISVDMKKKELIGNFKNNGKEWKPEGDYDHFSVYDFPADADGKAIPYGVYDVKRNEGWVNVGLEHDTA
jgi:hypothetical protein